MVEEKLKEVQRRLKEYEIDGWLLYDHHGSNPYVRDLLHIPPHVVLTRRFFYWIPSEGSPKKLVHRIEAASLHFLPGEELHFLSWKELEEGISELLHKQKVVAMEYSPLGKNPNISRVDGGTLEMIASHGVKVVSSDDLLQHFTSILTEKQIQSHLEAAAVLEKSVEKVWDYLQDRVRRGKKVTEYDVQKFILSEFAAAGCITEDRPTCCVNEHSAMPHYYPEKGSCFEIQRGDFVLIDLWCRKDHVSAVYADITRVAVMSSEPTPRQQEIFESVRGAQKKAIAFLVEKMEKGEKVRGYEVDDVCRQALTENGYGEFFIHRTGHNIDTHVHGAGANFDNLETTDNRRILPGMCFSIEPGIYLPGEFGIRLENDVLITPAGEVRVTGGTEEVIRCLL